MAAKKQTLSNAVLSAILRNVAYVSPSTIYLALYTETPTASTAGTEVTGGSYARQPITFAAASGALVSSSADVTFPAATTELGPIVGWAIHDDITAGNQLYFGPFSFDAITLAEGDRIVFPAGAVNIAES